eukprot:1159880-Pelagomonas_calceolata.AAC.5
MILHHINTLVHDPPPHQYLLLHCYIDTLHLFLATSTHGVRWPARACWLPCEPRPHISGSMQNNPAPGGPLNLGIDGLRLVINAF